jgi:hypothetical protein
MTEHAHAAHVPGGHDSGQTLNRLAFSATVAAETSERLSSEQVRALMERGRR